MPGVSAPPVVVVSDVLGPHQAWKGGGRVKGGDNFLVYGRSPGGRTETYLAHSLVVKWTRQRCRWTGRPPPTPGRWGVIFLILQEASRVIDIGRWGTIRKEDTRVGPMQ